MRWDDGEAGGTMVTRWDDGEAGGTTRGWRPSERAGDRGGRSAGGTTWRQFFVGSVGCAT